MQHLARRSVQSSFHHRLRFSLHVDDIVRLINSHIIVIKAIRDVWNCTFGLDIVVISYFCNLQQILQRYCAVLNELCTPDFDTVVNKQQEQVSNVIAF